MKSITLTSMIAGYAMLSACSSLPVETVPVDGADLGYSILGNGSPVVVLEAGLGDGRASWQQIALELSADMTVLIYDRPGYGRSLFRDTQLDGDGDGRSGAEIATALHGLLEATGLSGPYILAGHSIGGLYVQSFAKLYPEETAGLILVDSRPPLFSEHCIEESAGMCTVPAALRLLMDPHVRAEIEGANQTMTELQDPADLGSIPITVLAASRAEPGQSRRFHQLWLRDQQAFAEQARNARYVLVPQAGHYIHRQRPDVVLAEIRAMVAAVGEGRSMPETGTE